MRHGPIALPVVLLVLLLFAPSLPASTRHTWDDAENIPQGTRVIVQFWGGENLRGSIESVSDTGMIVKTISRQTALDGRTRAIDRNLVRKIYRIHKQPRFPDPAKCALVGALIGAGVGAATDGAKSGDAAGVVYWGAIGGLAGMLVGEAGCVAATIVIALPTIVHPTRLVYQADRPPFTLQPLPVAL